MKIIYVNTRILVYPVLYVLKQAGFDIVQRFSYEIPAEIVGLGQQKQKIVRPEVRTASATASPYIDDTFVGRENGCINFIEVELNHPSFGSSRR